jgi:hypothetical protein
MHWAMDVVDSMDAVDLMGMGGRGGSAGMDWESLKGLKRTCHSAALRRVPPQNAAFRRLFCAYTFFPEVPAHGVLADGHYYGNGRTSLAVRRSSSALGRVPRAGRTGSSPSALARRFARGFETVLQNGGAGWFKGLKRTWRKRANPAHSRFFQENTWFVKKNILTMDGGVPIDEGRGRRNATTTTKQGRHIMRKKPRSNSILHGLTPEQREQVDGWLFRENDSYSRVVERCWLELKVQVSRSSVARYYARECIATNLEQFARNAGGRRKVMAALKRDARDDFDILLGITGKVASNEALRPDEHMDFEKLVTATRLLISARKDGNGDKRALLQYQKMALEDKRMQLEAAMMRHRLDQQIAAIAANDKLSDGAKVMAIRDHLYGAEKSS